jgi:microcystin degradation protein MlrC
MGKGKVLSVNPLNGYLYADIPEKGMNRFDLVEIKFDRREANKLKMQQNKETNKEIEETKHLEKE